VTLNGQISSMIIADENGTATWFRRGDTGILATNHTRFSETGDLRERDSTNKQLGANLNCEPLARKRCALTPFGAPSPEGRRVYGYSPLRGFSAAQSMLAEHLIQGLGKQDTFTPMFQLVCLGCLEPFSH